MEHVLEFFIDNDSKAIVKIINEPYVVSINTKLRPYSTITRKEAITKLAQDAIGFIGYSKIYVSSLFESLDVRECNCKWWNIWYCSHGMKTDRKYVMCLDCDTELHMVAALRYLKISNIGHALIQSGSPGHYWVITDFVGDFDQVLDKMRSVPGVDPRYVDCALKRKTILLRAYPKIDTQLPVFSDTNTLTNKIAIEWYDMFKNYWLSNDMISITAAYELQQALKNGTIKNMVGDPKFVI